MYYSQIELRGKEMLPRRPHELKIIEPLDDRRLYHGERKMILNENDSRAMPSSQFTVN
jgi:hypothetical protein